MTRQPRKTKAWRQALALLGVLVAAIAVLLFVHRKPAGRVELKIPVSELRAQAAELELFAAQAGSILPRTFVVAHATQLAKRIDFAHDELASLHPQPQLAALRDQALKHAEQLAATADALIRLPGPLSEIATARLHSEASELKRLEQELEQ
jgi:hypothetical protein